MVSDLGIGVVAVVILQNVFYNGALLACSGA